MSMWSEDYEGGIFSDFHNDYKKQSIRESMITYLDGIAKRQGGSWVPWRSKTTGYARAYFDDGTWVEIAKDAFINP